jgi:FixJ family two-component response regulator
LAKLSLIAVVDDDDSIRESLRHLLRSLGFTVEVFASGEKFLQSNHLRNTECLILDVRMPGMSGLELQRHLAAIQAAIPIIFITAHGDDEMRSRALRAGAVDYLPKPFSEEALLAAIHAGLSSK